DGGQTWQAVNGWASGRFDLGWQRRGIALEAGYAVAGLRLRFHLRSDPYYSLPGWYLDDIGVRMVGPIPLRADDCERDGGGLSASGTNPSWAWGAPSGSPGPGSAHSGAVMWATTGGPEGGYNAGEDSYLSAPPIDLTAFKDQYFLISWWQWLQTAPR